MTSMRSTANVELSGPFFQHDPGKTFIENVHDMMQGIADAAATAEREGFLTGAESRRVVTGTGDRVADHVVGRVQSVTGKRWVAAAVAGVLAEGLDADAAISLMAAASYVERRTGTIRRVSRQINAAKADLAKGLE